MSRFLPARFVIALILVVLADSYGVNAFFGPYVRVEWWALLLVYYTLFYSQWHAFGFALLLGLVRDCLSQAAFGGAALGMVAAAIPLRRMAVTFNREQWYVQMVAATLAAFAIIWVELLTNCALTGHWGWMAQLGGEIGKSALLTGVVSPFVLKAMQNTLGRLPTQLELFH